jgi:fumarate reductase flavoprotein subunit
MSEKWDLIVVGAGSAGLPAAIFAAESGARVLQVEADGRIGGTLHWSSGQISAAGTSVQRELGIEDSPEAHYEDAQRIARGTIDPVLGRLATEHAGETLEWLLSLGYELAPEAPQVGVTHEPYLVRRYYWGPRMALSILDVLAPVHQRLVDEGSIDLRLGTRMTGLLTDADGTVTGIETEGGDGGRQRFHGANVALTSGGYAANPDLWQELLPDVPLRSFTNPYSRGDGVLAARALGARVDGEDKFLCTFAGWLDDPDDPTSARFFTLAPTKRRPWEIYVDVNGRRFVREDHPSIDHLENALRRQPETRMFIVADEGIFQNAPPICLEPETELKARFGRHPNFMKASTLAGLAARMGVDAATLEETVADYNRAVDSGHDPELGREIMYRRIETPPFYAMGAGGVTVASPAGLAADAALRVLDDAGRPIPGLYAAGEVLGFTRLSGDAFVGGMSLMPALTFGRLLGQRLGRAAAAAAA